MIDRKFFVLIAFCIWIRPSFALAGYSMEDLQILESQKSYKEFLAHARDIRPTDRSPIWQQMLSHMGQEMAQQYLKGKFFSKKNFDEIEAITTWPELSEDEGFHMARNEYILGFLENCFITHEKDSTFCKGLFHFAWSNSKLIRRFPRFGVSFYQLATKYLASEASYDFLTYGLLAPSSEFACKNPVVQNAIVGRFLNLVEEEDVSSKKVMATIDNELSEDCFQSLRQYLIDLLQSQNVISRNIAYQMLSAKKALSQDDEDFYLVLNLLKGPIVGPFFNLGWNRLDQVAQDHSRRSKLVARLQQLDPLPDGAFTGPDQKQVQVLLDKFIKSIPEYMDFYVQSCVDYLSGKKDFQNGNPTINCRNLKRDLIDTKAFPSYAKLKKLNELLANLKH